MIARLAALPGMTPAVPFMATAVLLLPLVGLGLFAVSARVAAGEVRTYPVLAVNHLITLGWGTLLAMGSIHQMFPAMIGVPLRPGRAALVQFGLSLTGAVVLVIGFLLGHVVWIAVGGTLAWIGIVLFVWLTVRLIPQRRRWLPETTGVLLALIYLLLAATWGLLMGLNWTRQFWPGLLTNAGVGVHAALGVGGWFVQLVVSVSYYLLPRFMGLHRTGQTAHGDMDEHSSGDDERAPRLAPVLILLNTGVILLLVAAFAGSSLPARTGATLLAAAGVLYAGDLARILRARQRTKPDLTVHHWWAIWGQTVLLLLLAAVWAVGGFAGEGRRVAAAAVTLLLTGWLTLAIMGQLSKVTPFLMWYYRFALGMPAAEVPRLAAPYYPAAGIPPFYLSVAGSTLLAAGVLFTAPLLARAGSLLFLIAVLAFWYVMAVSWIRAAARQAE